MVVRPVVCRAFIGRREELAFLHERRLLAGKSHGGAVLVAGDAGIGKSRLLFEFCASLAKRRWRIGYGANLEHAQRPYGPILDVLAAFDGGDDADVLLPEVTKRQQFDAIAERFERAAAKTALVAVIEDLHWADTATLELLQFLVPKLERLRVLLLASLRPRDVTPADASYEGIGKLLRATRSGRVDLTPLDERSLRLFIDETLVGHSLPEETRRAVARTSEGNPFFAEELLKIAVERSTSGAPIDAGLLPLSLRATLLERWHILSEADRRIVAQAAVIGRDFDLSLLARTLQTEIDELLPALARARDIQLVEEAGPTHFRFRHALTRDAIYAGFLGAQVRPLHRSIAAVLETAPEERRSLEGLAYHWWAAGDGERAARYNELAGDAAGRVHAHEDAIAFYTRALESPALGAGARGAIVEKIADRCVALSFADRANETYAQAADLFARARDDDGEARCRVRAAITAYTIGRAEPAAPLEALIRRLGADSYVARGRVHLGLAWLAATFWQPTKAAAHLTQVDGRALGVADIALRFHNVSAWVAMTVGDLETFRREHAAWIDAARNGGAFGAVASAHYNGAWCYSMFGLHEEAFGQIDQALEAARAERSQHAEESAHGIAAVCYLMSGDLTRARAALEAVPPTTDNLVTLAHGVACGTLIGAYAGDDDLIAKWFDVAGNVAIEAADGACGAGLVEVLIRRGRPAEARAVLRRAITDCERPRGNVLTQLAAARYGAPEDAARARAQLVAAAQSAADLVERYAVMLFDAFAARRELRQDEGVEHARAAAEGFRRLRYPLLEAAAWETAGDTEAALALYRACGAGWDARRLVALLPPDDGRRAISIALSQREREIATLVARGKSNVEIARKLSISHKTVEKHLGSVYQKLGISSRAELAAHVGRGPEVELVAAEL